MIELLLVVLLAAVAYALGRAHDHCDELRLRLLELLAERGHEREHWRHAEQQLRDERQVWHRTAAVQQAAREAMHDAVARAAQPPPARPPVPSVIGVGERHRGAMAAMAPAGLRADKVQSQVRAARP